VQGRNWGRWGDTDERGALNLVDEVAVRRGLASVRHGRPISLGLPVRAGAAPRAVIRPDVQHLMLRDGGDYAAGLAERPGYGYADDLLVLACHATTHLDALAHVWQDALMWNGYSAHEVTSRGAARAGIDAAGPVVTRGILLDLADDLDDGDPVSRDLVAGKLEEHGVVPEPGDALLVRTGWLARWRQGRATADTWPGFDASVTELVDRFDLAVLGADTISTEQNPSADPRCALPVHIALIRDRGVPLLELLDLEELAAQKPTTFLLVLSPLRIAGGTGSPLAPTAVL